MALNLIDSFQEWLQKEEARNRIRKQIREITTKINAAAAVKVSLINMDTLITNTRNKWDKRLSAFLSSVMSPVVVTDKFEGDSADAISANLPTPIEMMSHTSTQAGGVQTEIAEQLSKLGEYIGKLEDEKAIKEAELAAI